VPVLRPVEPGDRLQCIELDDYRVAAITHTGPYEELGEAHAALGAWVRQHQRETAGPCLECFLTGPGEAIDPAGWRTEVLWPIR
jgi:effector-binding domain-containing protein